MTGDRYVGRDNSEINVSRQGQYAGRDVNGLGQVQYGGGHVAGNTINGGTVNAQGSINNNINYGSEQQQTLAEAAKEIEALLKQLDNTYRTDTMSGQIDAAKEAMNRIKGNTPLADKILRAVKAGGISALQQILNHPAASFVLGFIGEWQNDIEAISDRDAPSNVTSAPLAASYQESRHNNLAAF